MHYRIILEIGWVLRVVRIGRQKLTRNYDGERSLEVARSIFESADTGRCPLVCFGINQSYVFGLQSQLIRLPTGNRKQIAVGFRLLKPICLDFEPDD
jgi:hypothetical protein